MDDETFEIIKAGAPNAPPEQALYRIQQTYPDASREARFGNTQMGCVAVVPVEVQE